MKLFLEAKVSARSRIATPTVITPTTAKDNLWKKRMPKTSTPKAIATQTTDKMQPPALLVAKLERPVQPRY